jgi:hypothetical protein
MTQPIIAAVVLALPLLMAGSVWMPVPPRGSTQAEAEVYCARRGLQLGAAIESNEANLRGPNRSHWECWRDPQAHNP